MKNTQEAIFAAGCFWGVEEYFKNIPGVVETEVGYTGGVTKDPTYDAVCGRETGHAEAIRIVFDTGILSYGDLLRHFWNQHDPTTKDRQGPDVGDQYRSAIFYTTKEQEVLAEKSREEAQKNFDKSITTEIAPALTFYRAEEYHQRYIEKQRGG